MARPQVSIRLATDGKAQVQRDFAEIADAGGAHAARLRSKWESETQQIERLTDRAAKTAQRLAAVSSTPIQQRIGQATGIGADPNGAARASAKALAAELDRAETEARQLIAAIDPLFAAQSRYGSQVARINDLKRLGVLSESQYVKALALEEQALDEATRAQLRHRQSAGAMRAGMSQLSFQIGDVTQQMALGVPMTRIFIQQGGQVVQAFQLMGGEGNKFLKILGGPVGMAASLAAVVAVPIVAKLLQTKDATGKLVDEMREQAKQAEINSRAEDIFARSVEGVAKAIRDATKARKDAAAAELSAGERANIAAQANVREEISIRNKTRALVADALAQAQIAQLVAGGSDAGMDIANQMSRRASELQRQLATADAALAAARAELLASRADLAEEAGKRAADPIAQINRQYDAEVAAAKKASTATIELSNAMADQIKLIEKRRQVAIKAAQEANKPPDADLTRFISPVDGGRTTGWFGESRGGRSHAGVDLAVPVGTSVHAAAAGTVIEAGNLPGFGNVVIIDHGRGTVTRYAHLSQFNVAKGQRVEQSDVIALSGGARGAPGAGNSEGPHLHYEVRRAGKAVNPSKGAFPTDPAMAGSGAIRSAESEAERAIRQQNAFEERRDDLNMRLLAAQMELVTDIQQQAEFAERQVRADQARLDAALQNDVEEKKLTQAHADELKATNEKVAAARIAAIQSRKRVQLIEEQDRADSQVKEFQIEELRFLDEMARTQGEHRRLQLDIIDLVYQQKLAHLEAAKAKAEEAKQYGEAARIQAEINNLPEQKARDEVRQRVGTMSPGEEYLDRLPQSIGEINEALQRIQVGGLEDLNKGLVDALMNSKSLGDFFGNLGDIAENAIKRMIASLLDLGIQMLLIRPLAQSLFGGGAGGGGLMPMGGTGGGWLGGLLGAIFGGGGGGGAAGSDIVVTGFPTNAAGTAYFGGGLTWVGEHGKELVSLPRGSRIRPAAESRRLAAANDAGIGSVHIPINIDATGADAAGLARVQAELAELKATLPGVVVGAFNDARQRFVIR